MRPVLAGMDGLITVQTEWSIDDLFEAHEALDVKQEIEERAVEAAKNANRT